MNFKKAFKFFLLGSRWTPAWQKELAEKLDEAQKNLPLSFVVVIAEESDFYGELLFLLSFVGLFLGASLASFSQNFIEDPFALMLLPLLGFALGSTLFLFKKSFISRVAARAVRDKVLLRAKAQFYDYSKKINDPILLLYVSEMEKEATFVSSREVAEKIPTQKVNLVLYNLMKTYRQKDPLRFLGPALLEVGNVIRKAVDDAAAVDISDTGNKYSPRATDQPEKPLRVIIINSANKDIN